VKNEAASCRDVASILVEQLLLRAASKNLRMTSLATERKILAFTS
jgi:hypothetical protein